MSTTDHAIRIAELIKQLRDLYKLHNNSDTHSQAVQTLSGPHSRQNIDSCRSQLGDAVWDLSRSHREQSKQILSQAFTLAQPGSLQ